MDESQNKEEQRFSLSAGSKRVYNATGEIRANWAATSIHYGESPDTAKMLAMHAFSLRDFVGAYDVGPGAGFRLDDESLQKFIGRVEGSDTYERAPNNQ